MDPVLLINPIEVDSEKEVLFLERWIAARNKVRGQEGLLSLQLHRSIDPFTRFRFVIVERWQSEEALRRAMDNFGAVGGHHDFPCPHFPGLYRVFSH